MTSQAGTAISAETLKRAYLTIQQLQRRLADVDQARREPIAVIGLGCRFPGGVVDADSYWQVLAKGTDAVRPIPPDRWNVDEFYDGEAQQPGKTTARAGGFLEHIDRFDHEFFGISRLEALAMDPQQRLTLEVVWEALENAGQAPTALAGSRTGVFAAVCTNDFAITTFRQPQDVTRHTSQGTAHSAVAGMVSYSLDLRGPSVAVDTACSSSLVAVHLASQSLRSGECDLAVSGGVNVIMSPMTSIAFSQAGMLSRTNRSRPFDAAADGPVNGEGCGFVVLKRLSDALRDDDPVLAVLLGSAVNHNGRGSALTAPSSAAQCEVITSALRFGGVAADEVSYVEAHGSSTPIGDVLEAEALAQVYGRVNGSPLLLGSAKGNFGHLQAAGGIAGLIKVVLSLRHGMIPATLHLSTPNPDISFADQGLALPAEATPWPAAAGRRIAAVSTFGFTGTNAHLIIGQAPERDGTEPDQSRPGSVLALSAKTGAALARLARRYAEQLTRVDAGDLADVCYSANTGRAHFNHRLAVVGRSVADVADQLRGFADGRPGDRTATGNHTTAGDIVFLFPGQGTQRTGMAAQLLDSQPTFREALAECDEIARPLLGRSLLYALGTDPALLERPGLSEPALFSIEYALVRMWRSWGVEPAAVIGHDLGEYVAACVAETMSPADALNLLVERGRLLQTLPRWDAGHDPLPEPLLARLRDTAEQIRFSAPRIPMVCAVDGRLWPWQRVPDAEHWCRQLQLPGRFTVGVDTLRQLGYRAFLEIGPGPDLLRQISAVSSADDGLLLLPSLKPGHDDWQVLLGTLAQLYAHGAAVDWPGFDRDYRRSRIGVPTYPFEPTECRQAPHAGQGGSAA